MRGYVGGRELKLGRPAFCGAEHLPSDNACLDPEASIVAFSMGETRYLLSVRQGLRPDAQAVISALLKRGIKVEILSGDREPAVRAAAHALGVSEWRAGVTPADKIARIEELKTSIAEGVVEVDIRPTRELRSLLGAVPGALEHVRTPALDALVLGLCGL